ncbi:sigma-70 family RNA polymerase sigma factor [Patescibacteria group bacterium]|nr:sigma-70 family RNA polymerase sigma factor [Patescibacteria group bacterium]
MVDSSSLSDASVVAQSLKDKDSFAVLILRYEAKLDRYVRRLGVANADDRHDVLQDIFIKVYRNLNAFNASLSFSSWIYRIAHNETMSWFRKRKARPEGHMADDGDEILGLISGGESSEKVHLEESDRAAISEALERLPQKYRDVLVLRFFEERTYEEIADILEMPIGTVATLVFRAKDRLRILLENVGYLYGHA